MATAELLTMADKGGALQHVLRHGDRLAQIFLAAAPLEDVGEEIDYIRLCQGLFCPRRHCAAIPSFCASAAWVERSPSISA